jgi:2-dehydropantoate 2-reductase
LTSSSDISLGILGLGSIGCLLASQVPNSIKLYALSKSPLPSFDFSIQREEDTQLYQLPSWSGEALDLLVICCKASQTLPAIDQWQSAVSKKTQIVLLQNGYGQHEEVAKKFPNNTLFAASTTEGANRVKPQVIKYAGVGQTQWGYYSGPTNELKIKTDELNGQHLFSQNIKQVLIEKLAINAVINPLTVKYNCPNGELIKQTLIFNEFKNLCTEVEQLYLQLNWSLSFNLFERAKIVAQLTANNISSMLQDYRNQKATEINYINGYLVNKAKEKGIDLPINEALLSDILTRHFTQESS